MTALDVLLSLDDRQLEKVMAGIRHLRDTRPHHGVTTADDFIITCASACCNPDFDWTPFGGDIGKWLYCGPLGLGCACGGDPPPPQPVV